MKRTAVVLGASEGIGFASAQALVRDGHRVAIFSRSADKLSAARETLEKDGGEVLVHPGDVASADDLESLFAAVDARFGGCEILVNNRGGPPPGATLDFEDADWETALSEHALPVFRAVRRVVPGMKEKNWGRIITVASLAVKQPIDDLDLSNFIRGGLASVHKTLARTLAREGINVHMVLPGPTMTERSRSRIQARADKTGISFEEARKQSEDRIPKGRLGKPEEVADVVAFLASDRAEYLTAQYIQVDGGLMSGLY